MPRPLDPRLDVLPAAQRAIWDQLRPAPRASFVLYGGTAVALHLGHRQSIDFDFFRAGSLDKEEIRQAFPFVDRAAVLQDRPDTYVVSADIPEGPVKVSFFGGLDLGRVNDPLITRDHALPRRLARRPHGHQAEGDSRPRRGQGLPRYRADAARRGLASSRPLGRAAFKRMFRGEPAEVLRALGFFGDGDLGTLAGADRLVLCDARDRVRDLPDVVLSPGLLAAEPERPSSM